MKYMLLLYSDPSLGPAPDSPEGQAEFGAWMGFTQELGASGALISGEALHPKEATSQVRVRDGRTITADGPFAETKEVLGGFYLIEADDLDGAIKWAERVPNVHYGTVEIRPVVEFDQG